MDRRGFIKALTAGAAVASLSAQGGTPVVETPPAQPMMRLRQILIDDSRGMASYLNSREGEEAIVKLLKQRYSVQL